MGVQKLTGTEDAALFTMMTPLAVVCGCPWVTVVTGTTPDVTVTHCWQLFQVVVVITLGVVVVHVLVETHIVVGCCVGE
jgi:hypothetical protein